MTADVYAGDTDLRGDGRRRVSPGVATFDIIADPHVDLLLRVGVVLNLLNTLPRRVELEIDGNALAQLRASVECDAIQADLIARKLRQLTAVREVELRYGELPASID
jgi:hypothetical protein